MNPRLWAAVVGGVLVAALAGLWALDRHRSNDIRCHTVSTTAVASIVSQDGSVTDKVEKILNRDALSNVYGGDVIRRRNLIEIYVINGGQACIKAALAPLDRPESYRFTVVKRTWATLKRDVATVAANHRDGLFGDNWRLVVWYPDPPTNRVVFEIKGNLKSASARLHSEYPHIPMTLKHGSQVVPN